jgi:hypothetical protein
VMRWWPWKCAPPPEVLLIEALGLIVGRCDSCITCSTCQGRPYEISTTFQRIAQSGEAFTYLTGPFAWLCVRCKAMALSCDMSRDNMSLDAAAKRLIDLAAKSRSDRQRDYRVPR